MKTIVTSVVLSGLVAYGVSTKVAREARIERKYAVQKQIDDTNQELTDAVQKLKDNDDFRAEQYADLNARCYFALQNLDDMNHMIITQSKDVRENRKDVDLIIELLKKMRDHKK